MNGNKEGLALRAASIDCTWTHICGITLLEMAPQTTMKPVRWVASSICLTLVSNGCFIQSFMQIKQLVCLKAQKHWILHPHVSGGIWAMWFLSSCCR